MIQDMENDLDDRKKEWNTAYVGKQLEEEPEDVGVKKSSIIAALFGVLAGMILSSFLFGWN